MRGFAHILLLLVIVSGMTVGLYLVQQKTHLLSQALSNTPLSSLTGTNADEAQTPNTGNIEFPSPTPNKSAPTFLSIFDRLKARATPTPTPIKSSFTPTPSKITSTPIPTKTPTSAPTPTPTPPSTCGINALATPLNPSESFDNLQTILLVYSANYISGNKYVTGAQWDFDGNDSWDTDMSLSNGSINHTFPGNGSYNVKLQLRMNDGEITPVCSKTVIIPLGIEVKVSGKVYSDDNCDDYMLNEAGISGAPVNIYLEKTNTYSNLQTDANGNYQMTKIIDPSNSVLVQSTTEAITDYTLHSSSRNQVQTYTLDNSHRQIFVDLSQVPLTSVGLCQAY